MSADWYRPSVCRCTRRKSISADKYLLSVPPVSVKWCKNRYLSTRPSTSDCFVAAITVRFYSSKTRRCKRERRRWEKHPPCCLGCFVLQHIRRIAGLLCCHSNPDRVFRLLIWHLPSAWRWPHRIPQIDITEKYWNRKTVVCINRRPEERFGVPDDCVKRLSWWFILEIHTCPFGICIVAAHKITDFFRTFHTFSVFLDVLPSTSLMNGR